MGETWIKPEANFMKCNIDVSFSTTDNSVGFGIIIRDDNGHFVKAQTIQITPFLQVQEEKAKALKHAINWITELGFVNVVFELDDEIVVDAFNNPKVDDMSEFGLLIGDCRNLVDECLPNSRVVFTMKKANKAAGVLASVALDMVYPQVYDHVPLCIAPIVFKEMI
ncbi:unnamed protein product [Lathyrus sativus]|nr:unnamed protein product [Lathyrus sativus]